MVEPSDTPDDLGRLVNIHEVDNTPHRVLGRRVIAVSPIGLTIATILTRNMSFPEVPTGARLDDALLLLSLMAFAYGAVHLSHGLHGMPERFEVHEGGLVHVFGQRTQSYPWDRIAFVRVLEIPAVSPIGRYLGNTYGATAFHTRRRKAFAFNNLTHRATDLQATILANCAAAPPLVTRKLRFLLRLYLILAFATLIALIGSILD